METSKKMTIDRLAELSQQQFLALEKKMDSGFADVHSDVKLILSAIENLSGQIVDVKQATLSAFDFIRLEDRVDVIEEKLGIVKK